VSIPPSVLLQGLVVGLNYGLLAMGLVLVYRTNRVLNFAQGQFGVVAAVFLVKCNANFHFNYWFSLALAVGLAAIMAALTELLARRLFNRPRLLLMVYTIGISLVLFTFTALPFIRPSTLSRPFPVPIHLSFSIGSFVFTPGEVLTLIVAPIVALALTAFIRWSPWGLAMRAMSENADSARLSGVWVRRTSTMAWSLAGVLSAFTAILAAPGQTSVLTQPLSPDLLLFALTAALVGAMVNLTVAFVAGIGVGVIYEFLSWNISSTASIQTIMFGLLLAVLLVRVAALRKGVRSEEQSNWLQASASLRRFAEPLRARVGSAGVAVALVAAALAPLVLSVGNNYLFSEICIFAVIALSLTILTGWAGQVSLGQFGLVAVGAVIAAHLQDSVPLVVQLPFAGAVTAAVAVVVGLPALRVRGLYLAVSTLAFALWMQEAVLATPCWTLPLVHRELCTGLPNPASTLVARPTFFGLSLGSTRSYAWFSLGVLVLSVLMVRVWRDRGIARRLVAVRDNEFTAAAMGVPVVRTKLLAFALSGFMAGYAGVCLAFASQRFNTTTFAPSTSILLIVMVVIGGLGSVPGALLGAIYLVGLPAIFGTDSTIQFLTSGIGVVVFVLYLPGGLAEVMRNGGDLATSGVRWLMNRPGPSGTAAPTGGGPTGGGPTGGGPAGGGPAGGSALEGIPAAGVIP
jgi:ABC-type branched-subunit amino acid transport system permease subunit